MCYTENMTWKELVKCWKNDARWVPTENVNGFEICPGLYRDEGATAFQSAVNFTVHSKGAVTCELLLFHRKEPEPYAVIPFPENCRIGDVFP